MGKGVKMKKRFSIILPIYKNEENLPITIPYIMEKKQMFIGYDVELILVCDGSPDNSYKVMQEYQKKYPQIIRIASFTKNYGQRAAVNCGMTMATGDVIGVISADLQDPFELFADMLKYWESGEKFVLAYRKERRESGLGAWCSAILHKFINKNINADYPIGGFDFFLVDKSIAEIFTKADTPNNSMQLLLLQIAGKSKKIEYVRSKRLVGTSGWSFKKKVNQALSILFIYTDKPFKVIACFGLLDILLSVLFMVGAFILNKDVYFIIMGICFFMMGVLLIAISYLGICGFKWMQNARRLPRYVVDEVDDGNT